MAFDAAGYIKTANEKDAAIRAGKPVETPAAAATTEVAKPATEVVKPAEEPHARSSRSERREIRNLLRQVGELTGRLKVYEETGKQPVAAADPDAKPERAKFASDAEYTAALVGWQGKQESGKQAEQAEFQQRITDMAAKRDEDIKLIPDWEAVSKAAAADEDAPVFTLSDHPTFHMLLASSEYQALAMHYFAQHPDELEEILELTDKPAKQIEEFRALEGHLRREYRKLKAAAPAGHKGDKGEKRPEQKAEEKKAEPEKPPEKKLPRPSESVSVKGGSTPAGEVSPYLADGKTMNPAWKEQRNMREGLRR